MSSYRKTSNRDGHAQFSVGRTAAAACIALLLLRGSAFSEPGNSIGAGSDSTSYQLDTIVVSGTLGGLLDHHTAFSAPALAPVPGLTLDPLRSLAASPATVAVSDLQALPVIGGDDAERILVLLDGFQVTLPYRMLGMFSPFNTLLTREVRATATGYSAAYGGFFPGAVMVQTDVAPLSQPMVMGEFGLPLSSIALRVPLSAIPVSSLGIAGRMSHTQVLTPLLGESSRERLNSFVPVLRDAQLVFSALPSEQWHVEQIVLYSNERGSLANSDRQFGYRWEKLMLGTRILHSIGSVVLDISGSWASDLVDLSTSEPDAAMGFHTDGDFDVGRAGVRTSYGFSSMVEVTAGAEWSLQASRLNILSPVATFRKGLPLQSGFSNLVGFVESKIMPVESVELTAGIRTTWYGFLGTGGLEPRMQLQCRVSSTSVITLSAGRYLQPPSDFQVMNGLVSLLAMVNQPPRLLVFSDKAGPFAPEASTLWSLGLDQRYSLAGGCDGTVSLQGYFKDECNLILSNRYPSVFTPLDSNSFDPSQRFSGKKFGASVAVSLAAFGGKLVSTVSASYQRSLILDRESGLEYRSSADIPLAFKATVSYKAGSWKLSLFGQVLAGMPTTDQYYLRGTNIFDGSFYFPIWNDLNSGQLPGYQRLDISISKVIDVSAWRIEPFVEVLNVFGRKNVSHYAYSFSDGAPNNVLRTPRCNTLPLLTNVGVRIQRDL